MSLLAAYFALLGAPCDPRMIHLDSFVTGALVWAMITGRVTHEQVVMLQGLTIPMFAASKIPQIVQTFLVRPPVHAGPSLTHM